MPDHVVHVEDECVSLAAYLCYLCVDVLVKIGGTNKRHAEDIWPGVMYVAISRAMKTENLAFAMAVLRERKKRQGPLLGTCVILTNVTVFGHGVMH